MSKHGTLYLKEEMSLLWVDMRCTKRHFTVSADVNALHCHTYIKWTIMVAIMEGRYAQNGGSAILMLLHHSS